MLKSVSKIGTPRARKGSASPTAEADRSAQKTLVAEMTNPRNILPQSPMKTLAGLKLRNRKPMRLPSMASMNTATTGCPTEKAKAASTAQVIREMPAAKPSSPSMRFTALVIPTIQSMVMGQASGPRGSASPSPK